MDGFLRRFADLCRDNGCPEGASRLDWLTDRLRRQQTAPAARYSGPALDRGGIILRSAALIQRASANRERMTIPIVLATENPVETVDLEKFALVDEVIELKGMELPPQVPLMDSHQRDSVRRALGSIRSLRVEGGELRGTAFFAATDAGREAFTLYADGHLTDFSVGARSLKHVYRDGVKYVTRSRLIEGSCVAVGADPAAVARSQKPQRRARQAPKLSADSLRRLERNMARRGLG